MPIEFVNGFSISNDPPDGGSGGSVIASDVTVSVSNLELLTSTDVQAAIKQIDTFLVINENNDSLFFSNEVLEDIIGAQSTVPLGALDAVMVDGRPSNKSPGAKVYDDFGTIGYIDILDGPNAIITTLTSRGGVEHSNEIFPITKTGLGTFHADVTPNEIRRIYQRGKTVQLSFDDIITNTGEQLYNFETFNKAGEAVFRRNVVDEEKAERISIRVDYQGDIQFDIIGYKGLLTTGGTMTGALKFEDSGYIENNNSPSTKGLALFGDKDGYGKGATMSLRSNLAQGSQSGAFKFETGNNITGHTHTLQGNPDGSFTCDGKNIARSVNGNYADGDGNITLSNLLKYWKGSATEYNTKEINEDTLYFIEDTKEIYLGNIKISV